MRSLIFCAVTLAIAMVAAEDILKEEDLANLQDEKWFAEVYSCIMDKGPCTDKMNIYKELIPKYLETKCGSCSPEEKDMYEKIYKMVAEKYPNEFKELMEKMSPKAQ